MTHDELGWYRKSPKWHFWDKTKYKKEYCVYKKCDFFIEIYSPYYSAFTLMAWQYKMSAHYSLAHPNKKGKKK